MLLYSSISKSTRPPDISFQVLEEDDFARDVIAPEEGIKKSNFAEAVNFRGLEQLAYIYQNL